MEDIRFVLFVAAPVSLIAIPLLRARRKARRMDGSAPSANDALENLRTSGED
jgi:hypothetical protein